MRRMICLVVFVFSVISPVYGQKVERALLAIATVLAIVPGLATAIAALALFAVVFLWQRRRAAALILANRPADRGRMKPLEPPGDEPIVVPIEDSLDLHAFQPKDVASVVEEYLRECRQAGFSEVRLIHGKGVGVQRNIVRSVLSRHPAVLSYRDAPAEAGGWGATIVILKEKF